MFVKYYLPVPNSSPLILQYKHLLIVADSVNYIGVTGAEMLVQEAERWREMKGGLSLLGLKDENWRFLKKKHFMEPKG